MLSELFSYLEVDEDKRALIDDMLNPKVYLSAPNYYRELQCNDIADFDYSEPNLMKSAKPTKYCPECFKEYDDEKNFCYDCLCSLKYLSDMKNVTDIRTNPIFECEGLNSYSSFDEILTSKNIDIINDFKFSIVDFRKMTRAIKRTALKNMDNILKDNGIIFKELNTNDKVLLFAKSFVSIDFKSHGADLGHFEFDRITVDDRQAPSLLMTTLIHELSHFLLKEILAQIICKLLDCSKNTLIESIAIFILSYSNFTRLIDEYAAHTVEGRFTVFGYQDYSSFLGIEKSLDGEMSHDEIEITKSIGNTFAIAITDMLESFINQDLRDDIKDQFLNETRDEPNYDMLLLENCNSFTDEGFMKAIWLILSEGFTAAASNIGTLIEYEKCF